MGYVAWALVGMAGYSATTLFVKLATRAGANGYNVLAVAVSIVTVLVWIGTLAGGQWSRGSVGALGGSAMGWTIATGFVLAIAVSSLFRALSLGPASVVVPIYGMFIVGGAVLGILVLREPFTATKAAGIVLAVAGVLMITR